MRPSSIVSILACALLGACAHAPSAAAPVAVPETPAGERLAWFLKVLDGGGRLDVEEAEAAFTEYFREQVPASQFVSMTRQIALQVGSLSLESVMEQSPHALYAIARSGQGRLKITVSVERDAPHRFNGLLIGPARADKPRPASWEEVSAGLASLAPRTNLLAARIEGDRCEPLHAREPDGALAIGSTFKLWVLLAASDAVAAGKLDWRGPISVRDDWKSLPSGVLQEEPAGTTLTVEQVAREMISISDNTATDHLIRTMGREAVEAALARTGHAAPERNRPFLTTRDLFVLKLGSEEDRAAFLAMDEAARRERLAGLEAAPLPPLSAAATWKAPRHVDTLEWFASPNDLCKAMAALDEAGKANGSPVFAILSQNQGIRIDRERFPFVGFKGGSEPGVLNLTFLLRRAGDEATYFLSVGANDTEKGIDGDTLVAIAEGAIELLGAEAAPAAGGTAPQVEAAPASVGSTPQAAAASR